MVSFKLTTAALVLLSTVVQALPTIYKKDLSFKYGCEKVRGVNLGGWFVLEPWITPSLFPEGGSIVDEYTFCQQNGDAQNQLENHWNTWITQDDFNQIAAAGLNHVRIPIGYWAVAPLPGDPYKQGQLNVLDRAIGWARSAGLKVMLDLHGAPGSQNGFDNSGRRGPIAWNPAADQTTINAIKGLATRYLPGSSDVVTAIEVLNEPAGFALNMDDVKKFYNDGLDAIRESNPNTVVTIQDAFEDIDTFWNGFMGTGSGVSNVVLDTHQYQVFSVGQLQMSPAEHKSAASALGAKVSSTDKWCIVGEWTGAMTDCAKWLNGFGNGARYDGTYENSTPIGNCDGKSTGTVAGLSNEDKSNIGSFIGAQLEAYEQGAGWIFWTWKNEGAPEWHMQDLLQQKVFPAFPAKSNSC